MSRVMNEDQGDIYIDGREPDGRTYDEQAARCWCEECGTESSPRVAVIDGVCDFCRLGPSEAKLARMVAEAKKERELAERWRMWGDSHSVWIHERAAEKIERELAHWTKPVATKDEDAA